MSQWSRATVNIDYHIAFDGNFYSVPYTLVQQVVEVRSTPTTVEIFHKGNRIASRRRGQAVTQNEHRPKSHQAHLQWPPSRMANWARSIGPSDPVARKVYVNLQDQNIFAIIDPATDEVVGRYPVGPCKGNHGMALDPEHDRAFLSCEGNNLMTVFDLDKNQPIAFLPMAEATDVIRFDPGLNRIYAACYSGAISVFHQDDPNHYRKLEDFPVQHAVHSLVVDLGTHRFGPVLQPNTIIERDRFSLSISLSHSRSHLFYPNVGSFLASK